MAKYVRVVRTEIETDNPVDIFSKTCAGYFACDHCPMSNARNKSYKRYGWDAPSCVTRFLRRPEYWLKKFGWEVEENG